MADRTLDQRIAESRKRVRNFKVGDLVTTRFRESEAHVKRTITAITNGDFGSGRGVQLSAGDACSCCKRPFGTPIDYFIDASWAELVEANRG